MRCPGNSHSGTVRIKTDVAVFGYPFSFNLTGNNVGMCGVRLFRGPDDLRFPLIGKSVAGISIPFSYLTSSTDMGNTRMWASRIPCYLFPQYTKFQSQSFL